MRNQSVGEHMRSIATLVCLMGCSAPATADGDVIFGTWAAGGEASTSILGDLKITATTIAWDGSRSSPKCRTTYQVVDRTQGKKPYTDEGWPSSQVASETIYQTVKVRLDPAKCRGAFAYFRFAVAADDRNHLDVVEYNSLNQPQGWFSFYRLK